jgi:regulator of telomere elongation helicase 1
LNNNTTVPFPYVPYPYQTKAIQDLSDALQKGSSKILFESPTGTGKTQVLLSTLFNHLAKNSSTNRILYFTRTVSQMSHVVQEAKKSGFDLRASVLTSRKHTCINSKVSSLKTLGKINAKCKKLMKSHNKCVYDINMKKNDILKFSKLMDLEDIRGFGNKNYKCPFFMSRKLKNAANLVVLSYNYMSNPLYREKLSKYITNSIIVIDEAHNMEQIFEESCSIEWKMYFFKLIIRQLKSLSKSQELALSSRKTKI